MLSSTSAIAMPVSETVTVRPACADELEVVNDLVTRAVLGWPVSGRLKRLALPLLRYDAVDASGMEMLLAERSGEAVGVAVWDAVHRWTGPAGEAGALLHGLYVRPGAQGVGIGMLLQRRVAERAGRLGFDGLLVKSERVSVGYFERCGYRRVTAPGAFGLNYPYLFWMSLSELTARPGAQS